MGLNRQQDRVVLFICDCFGYRPPFLRGLFLSLGMPYILIITFVFLWVMFHKYQFLDLKTKRNTTWKVYRVLITGLFVSVVYLAFPKWEDLFLACSIGWLLFEIGVNVISLNGPVFYIGDSSIFDKKLGKWKWVLMFALLITAVITKLWIA